VFQDDFTGQCAATVQVTVPVQGLIEIALSPPPKKKIGVHERCSVRREA
jgi:hypothetical protein